MIEILLFSLSVSIDAFGYSLGFGSRNINIKLNQFLVLNLINTLVLLLFLSGFSNFEYLFKNPVISKISPFLLAFLGLYYVASGFNGLIYKIKGNKNGKKNKAKNNAKSQRKIYNFCNNYSANCYEYNKENKLSKIKNNKEIKKEFVGLYNAETCLNIIDFLCLFLVFIFENAFSTIVFYSNFNNEVLFVFSNFIFHFLFFMLGFIIGKNIATKINSHTSFLSGYIFLCLAYFELFF